MKNLNQPLKIKYLIEDIKICNSIIKTAGEPKLISLFKKRRDEARQKIKEL